MLMAESENSPAAKTRGRLRVVSWFEATAAAFSSLEWPGDGLEAMLQLVPFQCSISVRCWWIAVCSFWYMPTAQTSFGAVAATPRSVLSALASLLTLGLGTTCQALPS